MKHFLSKPLLAGAATVALSFALACFPVRAEKSVVVIGKDGSKHEVLLTEQTRLELGSGTVTVQEANGNSTQHNVSDIDRILIGSESSGINDLVSQGNIAVWPTMTDGPVNIAGATAGSVVSVFDLNGAKAVADGTVGEDNGAIVDLSDLKPGIYVLTISNHSVKIIKK